jgi:hypothetical protein
LADKAKRAADEAGAVTFGQAADVPKYPDKLLIYLAKRTTADRWILTDGQFMAALADRDTPPS